MKNSLILISLLITFSPARAQNNAMQEQTERNNMAGTYMLVKVDNVLADGSRVHLYGNNPHGILMLDNSGHYSLQIAGGDRQLFKAGDKSKGTDVENKLAIQGFNAHFGTFAINMQMHTITFFIKGASFPNWEGTYQVRPFTLSRSVFKYTVPAPTTGGPVTGEVEWKRIE
ncbi:MAG: lipocalin-like domain-containing protein [Mucilaginibacter sp.]